MVFNELRGKWACQAPITHFFLKRVFSFDPLRQRPDSKHEAIREGLRSASDDSGHRGLKGNDANKEHGRPIAISFSLLR